MKGEMTINPTISNEPKCPEKSVGSKRFKSNKYTSQRSVVMSSDHGQGKNCF